MSSILDPERWGGLHTEGCVLVEQACRKYDEGNIDSGYIDRTLQRLDNYANELSSQISIWKLQLNEKQAAMAMQPLSTVTNKGNDLYTSTIVDQYVAYQSIYSLFNAELAHKLHIIDTIRQHYIYKLQQQLISSNHTTESSPSSSSHIYPWITLSQHNTTIASSPYLNQGFNTELSSLYAAFKARPSYDPVAFVDNMAIINHSMSNVE